ncbi:MULTISPECIES: hypothetical protein [Acidobacterium]|nr:MULTISPECIES: hypothetical protein [Acidobacterium]
MPSTDLEKIAAGIRKQGENGNRATLIAGRRIDLVFLPVLLVLYSQQSPN